MDPSEFLNALQNSFKLDDLRQIAFDLGIDYEDLPQNTKSELARELFRLCKNNGRLAELVRVCREKRPHLEWSEPISDRVFTQDTEDQEVSQKPKSRISTIVAGIAAFLIALVAIFYALGPKDWIKDVYNPSTPSFQCRVTVGQISLEKSVLGTQETTTASISVYNPDGIAITYNWRAVHGEMDPGVRSASAQSDYTAPLAPVDDNVSVSISASGCDEISRSVSVSITKSKLTPSPPPTAVTLISTNALEPTPILTNTPMLINTLAPTLTGFPTYEPTQTQIIEVRIIVSASLREGPGKNYKLVRYLSEGDVVQLLGKNKVGFWYNVALEDETGGWVSVDAFEVPDVPIPIVETIPPSPVPILTPTETATITPEATFTEQIKPTKKSEPIQPTPPPPQ